METMAPTPGTAEAPALSQDNAAPAPMAETTATSGTQRGPGELDLDASLESFLSMTQEQLAAMDAPAAPVDPGTPPETDPQDDPEPESEPENPAIPGKSEASTRNFRLHVKDPLEAQVLTMKRRNPDMPLPDIMAKVYGKPAEPAAQEAAVTVPVVETPQEVATLQAREAEIEKELEEATALFDGARIAALTKEIARIPLQIEKAERAAEARQAEAVRTQQAEAQAREASVAAAEALYPDLFVEGTPAYAEFVAVADACSSAVQASPEWAMIAAVQAARKLGLTPGAPKSSSPSAAVPEPRAPMPARPRPASGNGAAPVSAARPDYSQMTEAELDARVRAFVGG